MQAIQVQGLFMILSCAALDDAFLDDTSSVTAGGSPFVTNLFATYPSWPLNEVSNPNPVITELGDTLNKDTSAYLLPNYTSVKIAELKQNEQVKIVTIECYFIPIIFFCNNCYFSSRC